MTPQTDTPLPALPAEPPRRGGVSMPAWLATILILLVAGGLGYGAWCLVRPAPKVDLSQYEAAPGGNRFAFANGGGRPNGGPNGGGRRFTLPETAEAVVLNPNGNGTARVNGLQVNFTNPNGKPTVRDLTPRVSDPADNLALAVRSFALNNAARRTAANVADAQVTQLKQIKMPPAVGLTPEQQATLLKAWDAVKTAKADARPAAEKALLDAMRTIAAGRKQDATAVHAAADQIRGVLNPTQIALLQKPPAAATQRKPG